MGDATLCWCASPDWPIIGCVLVRIVDGSAYIVGSYCTDGGRHEGVDDDGIEDTMGIPATREVVRWWLGASGGCGRSIVRGYAQDADAAQAAIEAVADALGFVGVDVDGDAVWQTDPSGNSGELEARDG